MISRCPECNEFHAWPTDGSGHAADSVSSGEVVLGVTLGWIMKCQVCKTTSTQSSANSPQQAYDAMVRFIRRTCESNHFEEPRQWLLEEDDDA